MRRVLSLRAHAVVRRYNTSAPKLLTAAEMKTWDVARVLAYAEGELKLGAKAVEVLTKNEITGEDLLDMTAADLRANGLPGGPANRLATAIAKLRDKGE